MKVLQINTVFGVGSTGRIADEIHKHLKNLGHVSYVAYGRGSEANSESLIRIGNSFDNNVHGILTRIFDKHGYGSRTATKVFIKWVKEYDPDIIHLHNIHGYYLNFPLFFNYLEKSKKNVIWTLHDCWTFTGHCSHYEYIGCKKWMTHCHQCPQKKDYPSSLIFDRSKRNYSDKSYYFNRIKNLTLVTPSYWLQNQVKKSFLKKYKSLVIQNGVDLDVFRPLGKDLLKEYLVENKFIILGVAGIWSNRKGSQFLIELSNYLQDDEIIVVVGKNFEPKQNDKIIYIPQTDDVNQLAQIYSMANLFLNPTLEDNFPTVNIEALACNVPVITFNSGGSPECILESSGIVIKEKNVISIRESIDQYRKNSKEYTGQRLLAERLFDKQVSISKYISLYKDILKIV